MIERPKPMTDREHRAERSRLMYLLIKRTTECVEARRESERLRGLLNEQHRGDTALWRDAAQASEAEVARLAHRLDRAGNALRSAAVLLDVAGHPEAAKRALRMAWDCGRHNSAREGVV